MRVHLNVHVLCVPFLRIKPSSLRSIREHSSHEKLEATLLKETLLQFVSLCSSMNELTTLRPCRWCSTEGCVAFLPNLNYQCIPYAQGCLLSLNDKKLEIYAYFEQNEIERSVRKTKVEKKNNTHCIYYI
uniref:Uncharacterized protein n=1 Tax=Glossina pallidipes TaxID=7398 RepID=A0A1A9ZBJ2_GLOPL